MKKPCCDTLKTCKYGNFGVGTLEKSCEMNYGINVNNYKFIDGDL